MSKKPKKKDKKHKIEDSSRSGSDESEFQIDEQMLKEAEKNMTP